MLADIFGTIAGILTSIRLIPQVYKSIKTKHTRDLATTFLVILLFQALFLLLYGLTKPDNLILFGNIVPFICSVVLLWLKFKYDKRDEKS